MIYMSQKNKTFPLKKKKVKNKMILYAIII